MTPLFLGTLMFAMTMPKLLIALASALGVFGMATSAFPLVRGASPDSDTVLGQAANLPFQIQVCSGSTDALTGGAGVLGLPTGNVAPICGTAFVTTAGVDAMTL